MLPCQPLDDLRGVLRWVARLGAAPFAVSGVDRSWVGTFVPSPLVYPLTRTILLPLAVSAIFRYTSVGSQPMYWEV